MVLSQSEFEELITDPEKYIEGDITWTKERSPWLGFRVEITCPAGYPLVLKGSYNPFNTKLTYAIIHSQAGCIYRLDLGQEHRNPNGESVGDTHKHRWDEPLRDKQAYVPPDITAPATQPEKVWEEFCQEAKLTHNGTMASPPPSTTRFIPMTTAPCQIISDTIGQLYTCSEVNGFVRIRTPYLYPDGDVIDLFLKIDTQSLTDLGETLRWLDMQSWGKSLSKKQDWFLQDIQVTYGIELYDGMLLTRVRNDLAEAVTRLAQGAIAVANLWLLNRTRLTGTLNDEIAELLNEHRIRYERDLKMVGRSARSWRVDFRTWHPRRSALVEVLSTGNRGAANTKVNNAVAAWVDLNQLQLHTEPLRFISLFDDSSDVWSDSHISQLAEFSEVCYVSKPEELIEQLVS